MLVDAPIGADVGFAVLADGMGGHAAGEFASKIAVTEVLSELKFRSTNVASFRRQAPAALRAAALSANACIARQVREHAGMRGMGTTLVALALMRDRAFWVSVGDSPLYLFRAGQLTRLNEVHSLAPQIDLMVRTGQMTEAAGRWHPDRDCLTSVVGGGNIERMDLPTTPLQLTDGDILLVASDGIETLTRRQLQSFLRSHAHMDSAEIAHRLLLAVESLDDPEQDNVALSVIRVLAPRHMCLADAGPRNAAAAPVEARSLELMVARWFQRLGALFRPRRLSSARGDPR
ncbi:serine/threonine protein phosphatase PrpC [Rhodovulum iodosum]|uniref:Serine/threonine protein phosphatase PrpC n=1 Tax=Rhodovulum iodosum TaxID=68291 RepID=A0ABV3XRX4_9RHOB